MSHSAHNTVDAVDDAAADVSSVAIGAAGVLLSIGAILSVVASSVVACSVDTIGRASSVVAVSFGIMVVDSVIGNAVELERMISSAATVIGTVAVDVMVSVVFATSLLQYALMTYPSLA
jgi:hypothetical protein